jgi:hypothetical protein
MRRPRDTRPLGRRDYLDTLRLMGFVPSPTHLGYYRHPEFPDMQFRPKDAGGLMPFPLRDRLQSLKRQLDAERRRVAAERASEALRAASSRAGRSA